MSAETANTSPVTRKIAANALTKLQAGKTPNKTELEALEQVQAEQSEKKPMRSSFGDAVRWTIDRASIEFSIDTKTLVARLRRAGTLAGEDGRYSTAQIAAAVYGDLRQNQTRLVAAQADAAEVELARTRGEVVTVEEVKHYVSNMLFAVRRVVLTSHLNKEEQDAALKELADLNPKDFLPTKEKA